MNIAEFYTPEPQGSQAYGAPRPNGRVHTGDDFSHSRTPGTVAVPSLTAGTVYSIQRERPGLPNGYGNQVQIVEADGSRWSYSHLHSIARVLTVGRAVAVDDVLGTEGETGWTTGPCVHVERWEGGVRRDPYPRIRDILAAPSGGGSNPFPTPTPAPGLLSIQEDDMRVLYVTDSVDGNNVPGWVLLRATAGKDGKAKYLTTRSQGQGDQWASVWGKAATTDRAGFLRALRDIEAFA